MLPMTVCLFYSCFELSQRASKTATDYLLAAGKEINRSLIMPRAQNWGYHLLWILFPPAATAAIEAIAAIAAIAATATIVAIVAIEAIAAIAATVAIRAIRQRLGRCNRLRLCI
jgi:hypothetical protein